MYRQPINPVNGDISSEPPWHGYPPDVIKADLFQQENLDPGEYGIT